MGSRLPTSSSCTRLSRTTLADIIGCIIVKLRTDLAGLGPFIGIIAYLWGRTIWAAARYGGYPLVTAIELAAIISAHMKKEMIVFIRERVIGCHIGCHDHH